MAYNAFVNSQTREINKAAIAATIIFICFIPSPPRL